jgi:hypothetical protein
MMAIAAARQKRLKLRAAGPNPWTNSKAGTYAGQAALVCDVLVKAACVAFGFVYLRPFLDGNARLHRFLIQHVLARTGLMGPATIIPVSAVIEQNIPSCQAVLTSFSRPVTALLDYRRGDIDPVFLRVPGSRAYRFFEADLSDQPAGRGARSEPRPDRAGNDAGSVSWTRRAKRARFALSESPPAGYARST